MLCREKSKMYHACRPMPSRSRVGVFFSKRCFHHVYVCKLWLEVQPRAVTVTCRRRSDQLTDAFYTKALIYCFPVFSSVRGAEMVSTQGSRSPIPPATHCFTVCGNAHHLVGCCTRDIISWMFNKCVILRMLQTKTWRTQQRQTN